MNDKKLQIKAEKYIEENGIDKNTYAIGKAFRDGAKMMLNLGQELHKLLGTGWVSIEEAQPKPQERVYLVCENPKRSGSVFRFQTMAEYIPYMTVKENDYMADEWQGTGDYNEKEDEYYTPKGFYEWQSELEINWKMSAKITHWRPLIALP